MARISKKIQLLKAARAAAVIKRKEQKSTINEKQSSSSTNQMSKEIKCKSQHILAKKPKKVKEKRTVDPQKSLRGLNAVKKRIDKDNKKKEKLQYKMKNALRARIKNQAAKKLTTMQSQNKDYKLFMPNLKNIKNE